jgi:putative FmdB family regulatory protein
MYAYRCQTCGHEFEALQRFDEDEPAECPECDSENVKRLITSAPLIAKGVLAHPGNGRRASKEELRAKWAEETPKLRRKLVDKFGDSILQQLPTLTMNIDPTTKDDD